MCRFATLLSTETAAKDALLLTGSKKHHTQFSFLSRLQWNSRFHVEAKFGFRTLRIVPRRAPVVLFESNLEPKSDFHQTTYLQLLFATMDTPEGDPHGASFFSVSGGSDGNLSYNSVSCAQISSEVRHYCVFDETHCGADVCCGGFLAVEATLFQPIPDPLQSISGVDLPHHCKLAVIYPRILDYRLSRVRSATDVFVLVDSLADAFVCIHLGTAFLSLLRHARGQYRGRCRMLFCDIRLHLFSPR